MVVTPADYAHYAPHAVVTGLLGLFSWFVKNLIEEIKSEWRETKIQLTAIESTTRVQAENHLAHIQEESKKQSDYLERLVEGQAEMNGFLKGRASRGEV